MIDAAHPAWRPTDEQELRDALAGGYLEERQHLELKREIPTGPSHNLETARDLASLAIDGGRLVIGVDEDNADKNRPADLAPVRLDGLAERLEQVALTRIDPPLQLRFHAVPAEGAEENRGYLLVDIPASPQAPHMVDGRYWGRGDKTKHELADGEVERLMRRRHAWEADIHRILDEQEARDPTDPSERTGPHMLMVTRPVAAPDNALAHLFTTPNFGDQLRRVLLERPRPPLLEGSDFRREISSVARYDRRRAEGGALCNHMTEPRQPERTSEGALKPDIFELELSEGGTLRLFTNAIHRQPPPDLPGDRLIFQDHLVLSLAHHLLACCYTVAEEAGHYGNHDIAVALTEMHGAVGAHTSARLPSQSPPYSAERYRRTARVSPMELTNRPGTVVERLLGPLMRSLDVAQAGFTRKLLSDPEPEPVDSQQD